MKFTYLDYYMLLSAYRDHGDLFEGMCKYMPDIPPAASLAHSLKKLNAEGYLSGEKITDKGSDFFKSNKKFLESKKKMASRLEGLFLGTDLCGDSTDYNPDTESIARRAEAIRDKYNPSAIFSLFGNTLTVNCHTEQTSGDEPVDDEISFRQTEFPLSDGELPYIVNSFCDIVISLAGEPRNRKLCLWCEDGAYVLSFLPSQNGVKVSANRILFNKKSFRGKLDGKLDYAQTESSVLSFNVSRYDLAESLCFFAACHEDISDFPYEMLNAARYVIA